VDDEDFDYLSQFNWWLLSSGTGPKYAVRKLRIATKKWKTILMHRELLGVALDMHVDHINGNSLDNQKRNLRLASDQQNQQGFLTPRLNKTSKYRGVSYSHGLWRAQISVNKKVLHLGRFKLENNAAWAYDRAAKEYFGEFASPNFK